MINPKQYSTLKRQLPYFVCGSFNPPYRKKDNFAFTELFVLDIDKLNAKDFDLESLRREIQADPQVMVCFKSPSEDGLKVMFRLKERCYDAAKFSVFYKIFLQKFSFKHNLERVIDSVTSDVSRACFISIDPDIYYNPESETVDFNAFIAEDDVDSFIELKKHQEAENKITTDTSRGKSPDEPADDVLAQIKSKLNPKAPVSKPEPIVPSVLNSIIEGLKENIASFGIEVTEVINIQYGKKLRCRIGLRCGEINIFYGKRGFSFVKSPKAGTNDELNQLLCDIASRYIDTL